MNRRLKLQTLLEEILGSKNVYFQPPASMSISYPAIVYSVDDLNLLRSNNKIHRSLITYTATLVDKKPDSEYISKIINSIQMCSFERHYVSDNLNHYVFKITY
jgi:hypothetical protein